jgi:hypothetical protein
MTILPIEMFNLELPLKELPQVSHNRFKNFIDEMRINFSATFMFWIYCQLPERTLSNADAEGENSRTEKPSTR